MRFFALIVGCALVLSVLWLAGEKHRENCVDGGRTSCSVLPWVNGDLPGAGRQHTSEECALLREAAQQPFSTVTVPSDCE